MLPIRLRRRIFWLCVITTMASAYSPGLGLAVTAVDPAPVGGSPQTLAGQRASRKAETAARERRRLAAARARRPAKPRKPAETGPAPTSTTTTGPADTTTGTTRTSTAPPPVPSSSGLNPGSGVVSGRGHSWPQPPSLLIPAGSPAPALPSPIRLPGAGRQPPPHPSSTQPGVRLPGRHGGQHQPAGHQGAGPSGPQSRLTQTTPPALSAPPAPVDSDASIPSDLTPVVRAGLAAELKLLSKTLQSGDQPPVFLIHIYKAAARAYHVPWKILAAINAIETNYGRNLSVSSAGAVGWMQFMPDTWRRYGITPSGHGKPNPFDPRDAIFSAARYLAANGARHDVSRSLFAYNHASWYVDEVLLKAAAITDRGGTINRPRGAPAAVAKIIEAGNSIATDPYVWGGGHASFLSSGYDCSGSVSYALAAAGLLRAPMVSSQFESWGKPGRGKWITIYASADHVWMTIAGWRFDTVALSQSGTRWAPSGGELSGFVVRHPAGL